VRRNVRVMRIMEWETITKDKFSACTLHENREGLRHPKASEGTEGHLLTIKLIARERYKK